MSDPRTDRPPAADLEHPAVPDMLAELGPLAYGLVALGQEGPLAEIRTLQESRAARLPAQADRSPERGARSETLLDELGELDL